MDTSPSTRNSPQRPAWMLLVISLPLASSLGLMLPYPETLYQALLVVFQGEPDPSRLQRFAAGVTAKWLAPALLIFCALSFTRLRLWLALNRLTVGLLTGATGLLVMVALWGLCRTAYGEPPLLPATVSRLINLLVATLHLAGLATLLLSTAWHRLVADKDRFRRVAGSLFQEV